MTGGQAIGAVPVQAATGPQPGDTVIITCGAHPDAAQWPGARYVTGHGWWGAVSGQPLAAGGSASDLPFGPYTAASLAAAEVYLRARLPGRAYDPARDCRLGLLGAGARPHPAPGAPTALPGPEHVSGSRSPGRARSAQSGCTRYGRLPECAGT